MICKGIVGVFLVNVCVLIDLNVVLVEWVCVEVDVIDVLFVLCVFGLFDVLEVCDFVLCVWFDVW